MHKKQPPEKATISLFASLASSSESWAHGDGPWRVGNVWHACKIRNGVAIQFRTIPIPLGYLPQRSLAIAYVDEPQPRKAMDRGHYIYKRIFVKHKSRSPGLYFSRLDTNNTPVLYICVVPFHRGEAMALTLYLFATLIAALFYGILLGWDQHFGLIYTMTVPIAGILLFVCISVLGHFRRAPHHESLRPIILVAVITVLYLCAPIMITFAAGLAVLRDSSAVGQWLYTHRYLAPLATAWGAFIILILGSGICSAVQALRNHSKRPRTASL